MTTQVKFKVYYRQTMDLDMHFAKDDEMVKLFTKAFMDGDYKQVAVVDATGADDVFEKMQGFNWSPNGEARHLIEALGLDHTSMSVGDCCVDPMGNTYVCQSMGWLIISSFGVCVN